MGCDIHQMTWIWSKPDRKYVDIHQIDEYSGYDFPELYSNRYYDLFAVLSGVRGNRLQIPYDYCECGVPPCASKIFKKIYEKEFHSGVWFTPFRLMDALDNRINYLNSMEEKYRALKKRYRVHWYSHWHDDDPEEDSEMWYENDDISLRNTLIEIRDKVKKHYIPNGLTPYTSYYKYVDMDKIIIFFYFDS